MSHNLFLQSSQLVTEDRKLLKEVCAEEEGITLEELESEYDYQKAYICLTFYQKRALGQLITKKDSFKEGSPDAVMLITSELPSYIGIFKEKSCVILTNFEFFYKTQVYIDR